ncbi:hypothetical protein [Paractinoplanes durhamensis]|nr:hypothetical protein [Actinoplanes durhamensis]
MTNANANAGREPQSLNGKRLLGDAVALFLAATFLLRHHSILALLLSGAVIAWSTGDLLWALWSIFRKSTGRMGKGIPVNAASADPVDVPPEINLAAPGEGDWVIYPDLATGGMEIELRINEIEYLARFTQDEWRIAELVIQEVNSRLLNEGTRVELNSALAEKLHRKPFLQARSAA